MIDKAIIVLGALIALLELIRAGRVRVEDNGTLDLDRSHHRRKEGAARE